MLASALARAQSAAPHTAAVEAPIATPSELIRCEPGKPLAPQIQADLDRFRSDRAGFRDYFGIASFSERAKHAEHADMVRAKDSVLRFLESHDPNTCLPGRTMELHYLCTVVANFDQVTLRGSVFIVRDPKTGLRFERGINTAAKWANRIGMGWDVYTGEFGHAKTRHLDAPAAHIVTGAGFNRQKGFQQALSVRFSDWDMVEGEMQFHGRTYKEAMTSVKDVKVDVSELNFKRTRGCQGAKAQPNQVYNAALAKARGQGYDPVEDSLHTVHGQVHDAAFREGLEIGIDNAGEAAVKLGEGVVEGIKGIKAIVMNDQVPSMDSDAFTCSDQTKFPGQKCLNLREVIKRNVGPKIAKAMDECLQESSNPLLLQPCLLRKGAITASDAIWKKITECSVNAYEASYCFMSIAVNGAAGVATAGAMAVVARGVPIVAVGIAKLGAAGLITPRMTAILMKLMRGTGKVANGVLDFTNPIPLTPKSWSTLSLGELRDLLDDIAKLRPQVAGQAKVIEELDILTAAANRQIAEHVAKGTGEVAAGSPAGSRALDSPAPNLAAERTLWAQDKGLTAAQRSALDGAKNDADFVAAANRIAEARRTEVEAQLGRALTEPEQAGLRTHYRMENSVPDKFELLNGVIADEWVKAGKSLDDEALYRVFREGRAVWNQAGAPSLTDEAVGDLLRPVVQGDYEKTLARVKERGPQPAQAPPAAAQPRLQSLPGLALREIPQREAVPVTNLAIEASGNRLVATHAADPEAFARSLNEAKAQRRAGTAATPRDLDNEELLAWGAREGHLDVKVVELIDPGGKPLFIPGEAKVIEHGPNGKVTIYLPKGADLKTLVHEGDHAAEYLRRLRERLDPGAPAAPPARSAPKRQRSAEAADTQRLERLAQSSDRRYSALPTQVKDFAYSRTESLRALNASDGPQEATHLFREIFAFDEKLARRGTDAAGAEVLRDFDGSLEGLQAIFEASGSGGRLSRADYARLLPHAREAHRRVWPKGPVATVLGKTAPDATVALQKHTRDLIQLHVSEIPREAEGLFRRLFAEVGSGGDYASQAVRNFDGTREGLRRIFSEAGHPNVPDGELDRLLPHARQARQQSPGAPGSVAGADDVAKLEQVHQRVRADLPADGLGTRDANFLRQHFLEPKSGAAEPVSAWAKEADAQLRAYRAAVQAGEVIDPGYAKQMQAFTEEAHRMVADFPENKPLYELTERMRKHVEQKLPKPPAPRPASGALEAPSFDRVDAGVDNTPLRGLRNTVQNVTAWVATKTQGAPKYLYRGNRGPVRFPSAEEATKIDGLQKRFVDYHQLEGRYQEKEFYDRFLTHKSESIHASRAGDSPVNFSIRRERAQWTDRGDRRDLPDWAQAAGDQLDELHVVMKMETPKGSEFFPDRHAGESLGLMTHVPEEALRQVPLEKLVDRISVEGKWYKPDDPRIADYYREMVKFHEGGQRLLANYPPDKPLSELNQVMREFVAKQLPPKPSQIQALRPTMDALQGFRQARDLPRITTREARDALDHVSPAAREGYRKAFSDASETLRKNPTESPERALEASLRKRGLTDDEIKQALPCGLALGGHR